MPLSRRLFLAASLGGASGLLTACASPGGGTVHLAPGSRLIVVRHGDRTDENLNDLGKARAAALPAALEGMPLDAILSPGIQRNLDTAAPLAAARGLPITRMPQERPARRIAAAHAGKSVIWVGNKGNIQSIWDDLGLPGAPPLGYGDLFIVTADADGTLRVERRRWEP